MPDFLWEGDVILGVLGPLVEGPGVYVHPDCTLCLLLRDGQVQNAIYWLGWVHLLNDPFLGELLEMGGQFVLVVVWDRVARWRDGFKPSLILKDGGRDLHVPNPVCEDRPRVFMYNVICLSLPRLWDVVQRPLSRVHVDARLPQPVRHADVLDHVILPPLWMEADDSQVFCILIPEQWLRTCFPYHKDPGFLAGTPSCLDGGLEHPCRALAV